MSRAAKLIKDDIVLFNLYELHRVSYCLALGSSTYLRNEITMIVSADYDSLNVSHDMNFHVDNINPIRNMIFKWENTGKAKY